MALPPPKPPTNIPIEIPSDLQPAYANLARIAHAPAEFVMDFARLLPGDSKGSYRPSTRTWHATRQLLER
jgi:hypothetical protein